MPAVDTMSPAQLRSAYENISAELEAHKVALENAQTKLERYQELGTHDLAWYSSEMTAQAAQIEELKSEIKQMKLTRHLEDVERQTIAADKARQEELDSLPWQAPASSFRVIPHGINRDIFGDSGKPVFDLGVDLENFWGVVYVPVDKVIEMARSIGMLTKEDSDALREQYKVEKSRNTYAAAQSGELINGIHDLVNLFNTSVSSYVGPSVGDDEPDIPKPEANRGAGRKSNRNTLRKDSVGVSGDAADSKLLPDIELPTIFGS